MQGVKRTGKRNIPAAPPGGGQGPSGYGAGPAPLTFLRPCGIMNPFKTGGRGERPSHREQEDVYMKSAVNRRALYITETAVMTALLIVLQAVTKPAGQYVIGTCVNGVLAVSVLAVGLWSGVTVAALSPFFAFLLGIGPQLPQIVPAIAAGNLVFVLLLGLLAGGGEVPLWRRGIAWLAAAAGKFAALYLLVVKLLCAILPLKEPQVAMFTAMFSYPQLVTALAGGGIALLLTPLIRRAVRR